jgi:PAS domain S-box-containing protein
MKDEFEVLLLEKSEQNVEQIKDALKTISFDLGFRVCHNKKATTAYLSEQKPDAIICNNQLPDLDGREGVSLSKKMHPHVPFILISDPVGEEKAVDVMLEGADDFITTDNLERLGPAIQRELANYIAYKKAKQERDELKDNLEERVKEQQCLYNISSLNEHKLSVDELLNEAVSLIPAGFQDPNATEAKIRFNGEVFQTGDFGDDLRLLNKRISLNTGEEVNVKIGCAGGQAEDAEEQFLFEEKKLLVALAKILAQKLNQIHINEELNRQHDFLTEAYNVARIGHWELDLEAETLYWSDMVKKIHEVPLDYKPTLEEAIDFYRGDDRKKMEALVMDIIQNGGSYREDLKITTAKGNKRWVRVTGHAKTREKGKPRIYGTSQDITERKKVEEQLRKSEQRYQSLFEKNHAVMLLIDPQEDEILDANPAAEKFYGYSTEELRGMSVSDINTLSTEEVKAEMKNAVSENKKYFEFKHRLASGEVRDVVVYTGPITMGSEDLLYSIIYDNTQRKEAEKELRKLSAATEQSPALILITDKEGIIEYVNPKFAEVCGYDRDELIGENPNMLNSGKHTDAFYEEMWTTIKKGNTFRGEVTNQKKNGEYYDVLQQIAPIYNDEGEITHFLSVQEDITKRKKNERKLKKSLDEKRVLLSEIHHRVKNNLRWSLALCSCRLWMKRTRLCKKRCWIMFRAYSRWRPFTSCCISPKRFPI